MENPFAPELLIEDKGPVKIVTINRPEALNAVNPALHRALAGVWRHLAAEPTARAIVLTGAGRAFSAGGDMAMLERLHHERSERTAMFAEARSVFMGIVECPVPVIAAINGPAVGLGCSLAALCDLVYMAESSYLADPHVAVGLTAGDGGAAFWQLTMSIVKAKEYLFTGERIPANEAVALGLANRVVPDGEVLDYAIGVAERMAKLPPQALQSTKRAVNLHILQASTAILDYALAAEQHSLDTPEHQAIVAKFLGARPVADESCDVPARDGART